MRRYHHFSLFIILVFIAGCGGMAAPSESLSTPPLREHELNFLIESSGTGPVQIKRLSNGWDSFHPVSWGTTIRRGDLIQPPPDGTATILCADLTLHVLEQEGGNPCQVSQPELYWQDIIIVNPMSPTQNIPYILYPRNTRIMDERPLLKWQDTGAASYTVSIIADGSSIWKQNGVTETEISYPDDAPPLQPGTRYLLEIIDETTGNSSGLEPIRGLGFDLLSADEIVSIRQTQETILSLQIGDAAQNFALAVYYAGMGLNSEGLKVVEEASILHDSPQFWLWRGKILLTIRLNEAARSAYLAGAALAEKTNDKESQAQALVELWRITGEKAFLENAVALFQQLGDDKSITELENVK